MKRDIQRIETEQVDLFRRRIGHYEMLYPIGAGGMATVFAGREAGQDDAELRAIKIIHPHLARIVRFRKLFLDEASLAASIHHSNVAEVHDVGQDDGLFYTVEELVDGHNLRQFTVQSQKRDIVLAPPLYAHILAQACRGLHAAHCLKAADGRHLHLIHRDLSPRNIAISFNGTIKLIDFGVAWTRARKSPTKSGRLNGRIGFRSPEQIRGAAVDRRSNVFTMGIMLYLLATGRHPFPGKCASTRIEKILSDEFVLPGVIQPDIPHRIETIILMALAHNPQHRYPSAAAMADDLEEVRWSFEGRGSRDVLTQLMRRCFADTVESRNRRIHDFLKRPPDFPLHRRITGRAESVPVRGYC